MQHDALPTISALLDRNAAAAGDQRFLVIGSTRLTYAQMRDRARRTAASLQGLGVTKGDAVALLMSNCPTFLDVVFGCAYLGAIAVPINSRFQVTELRHVVPDSGAKVLVLDDSASAQADHCKRLLAAFPDLADGEGSPTTRVRVAAAPDLCHVVSCDSVPTPGLIDHDTFKAAGDGIELVQVEHALTDPAMMFYTSGTTSNPKGCPLTHESLVRVGATTAERLDYQDGDVLYDPLPMFHTASTQPMLAIMLVIGTFLSQVFPDPDQALALIAEEGATQAFTAFPTITESLLDHPAYEPDVTFRSVRTLFNVAPPDAQQSIQSRMPHTVLVNAFGMTETGGSATMVELSDDDEARLGTQGLPLPGLEIQIRDSDGQPVPAGTIGEVAIRGQTLFGGYHGAPEKNAEVFDERGYWRSGDLGLLRADGRLVFKGRDKDMLKVGGENVAAIEIESHLQAHPAVKIAQVIGFPDPTYAEVPAAFIELRAGVTATEQDIMDHCIGSIAGFKVPRIVRFVDAWPMSSTKVQKFKLREMLDD